MVDDFFIVCFSICTMVRAFEPGIENKGALLKKVFLVDFGELGDDNVDLRVDHAH